MFHVCAWLGAVDLSCLLSLFNTFFSSSVFFCLSFFIVLLYKNFGCRLAGKWYIFLSFLISGKCHSPINISENLLLYPKKYYITEEVP